MDASWWRLFWIILGIMAGELAVGAVMVILIDSLEDHRDQLRKRLLNAEADMGTLERANRTLQRDNIRLQQELTLAREEAQTSVHRGTQGRHPAFVYAETGITPQKGGDEE